MSLICDEHVVVAGQLLADIGQPRIGYNHAQREMVEQRSQPVSTEYSGREQADVESQCGQQRREGTIELYAQYCEASSGSCPGTSRYDEHIGGSGKVACCVVETFGPRVLRPLWARAAVGTVEPFQLARTRGRARAPRPMRARLANMARARGQLSVGAASAIVANIAASSNMTVPMAGPASLVRG